MKHSWKKSGKPPVLVSVNRSGKRTEEPDTLNLILECEGCGCKTTLMGYLTSTNLLEDCRAQLVKNVLSR